MVSRKSRTVAALLCFFVGVLGAHRFYVGKWATGLLMVGISCTGVGLILTGLWALVDFISICLGSFRDKDHLRVEVWN